MNTVRAALGRVFWLSVCGLLVLGSLSTFGLPTPAEYAGRFDAAERGQFGAVAGEDPWSFLPAELRFLSVEGFRGDAIRRMSRSRDKRWADPLPAIVDFHEQLKRMGIRLLVVPVPAKAAIYPDRLFVGSKFVGGVPKALGELYGDLKNAGVEVLDLTDDFIENRESEHGPVFCATDTHWSGLGCVLAAKVIAQQLAEVAKGPVKGLKEKWEEVVVKGDLTELPGKPATRVPLEKLWVRRISQEGGQAVKPGGDSSKVLLIGDSHTLVFSELLCEGAGLVEQLAFEMGTVPDLIGLRGAGATEVRARLLRRGMKEDGFLKSKKVVIWCFGAREFSEADSGWVKMPILKK